MQIQAGINQRKNMRNILKVMGMGVMVASISAGALAQNARAVDKTEPLNDTQNSIAKPADNTGVNVRDRGAATDTPQTQPNNEADRKLLAAVRRAVVGEKSLSTSAHNVKIIVKAGVVTLRGPVKTDDEKASVQKLAQQVAGVSSVENQLDVKVK
jgi:hyperosmotically inducible periplasmic protein